MKKILFTIALFLTVPSISLAATQTFTSNGAFTVPAGVTSVSVNISGGGGGGGNDVVYTSPGYVWAGRLYYPTAGGDSSFGGLITAHGGYAPPSLPYNYQDLGYVPLIGAAGGPGGSPGGAWSGPLVSPYYYDSFFNQTGAYGGASLFGSGGSIGYHSCAAAACWDSPCTCMVSTSGNAGNGTGYGAGGGSDGAIGGGGGAEAYQNKVVTVTPGQVIPVTVGASGLGVRWSDPAYSMLGTGGNGSPGFVQVTYTATPAPIATATLTASPNPIASGSQSTLTWSSTNATSCTAGGPWSNSGTLSGSGLTNPLTTDTNFTFQCTGLGGTSSLQSVTVVVGPSSCPSGQAYNAPTLSCIACSNGGCSGNGGTPASPGGSLTCNNGGTNVPTCTAPAAVTCTLPWGGVISSGSSVVAYQAPSVVSPATCTSQSRTCTNGTLSGSYTNQSCSVTPASCGLPWGGTISSGSSVTAYQSSSVVSPGTCTSQTRTCTNGTLSGSYTNQSCVITTPAPVSCTTPWGTTIASGASVTAYQFIAVTSPKTCASISENRTCTNGTLSGSFVNENCKVQPTFNAF